MYANLTKEQQLIILGLVVSIIIGLAVSGYRHFFARPGSAITIDEPSHHHPLTRSGEIVVHLSGAVKKEGVYKLNSGDRLIDLLELGGGASANANLSVVNLAEEVKNGQKITIPERSRRSPINRGSRDPDFPPKAGTSGQEGQGGLININTAGEEALDSLPGIGPVKAKAIVEYRRKIGTFARPEQIMEAPGIGEGRFKKIKNKITI